MEKFERINFEQKKENFFSKQAEELGLKIDFEKFEKERLGATRFITMLVLNEKGEEKFLKVFNPDRKEKRIDDGEDIDKNAFVREIATNQYLKENSDVPVLEIEKFNINEDEGSLFAVFETLPKAKIGFIKSYNEMEKLTPEHARICARQIFSFSENELPKDTNSGIPKLNDIFQNYREYKENVLEILGKDNEGNDVEEDYIFVRPLDGERDKNGEIVPQKYSSVLAARLGLDEEDGLIGKTEELFAKFEGVMKKYDGKKQRLVHGDLSPNNMYFADNGEVRPLDWEWAGATKNKLLAMIYDFGNLRARVWNNENFKNVLDEEILKIFEERGDREAGKAVAALGIFRSHAMLAGFFENYDLKKQELPEQQLRKENTEEDIKKAFKIADIKI